MPGMPFVLLKLGGKERKFRLDYNTLSMVKAILGKDWPGMAAFFRRVSDDPDLVKALYLAAQSLSEAQSVIDTPRALRILLLLPRALDIKRNPRCVEARREASGHAHNQLR